MSTVIKEEPFQLTLKFYKVSHIFGFGIFFSTRKKKKAQDTHIQNTYLQPLRAFRGHTSTTVLKVTGQPEPMSTPSLVMSAKEAGPTFSWWLWAERTALAGGHRRSQTYSARSLSVSPSASPGHGMCVSTQQPMVAGALSHSLLQGSTCNRDQTVTSVKGLGVSAFTAQGGLQRSARMHM